jgi:TM2 domain-containing membrane protein YozV
MSIVPSSRKIPAGLLAIFLGSLGVHKFYLGMYRAGALMLIASIVGMLLSWFFLGHWILYILWVVGFIEGIMYLVKSDSDFYNTYIVRRQEWF